MSDHHVREYDLANTGRARALRRDMTPWERKLWYRFLTGRTPRWRRQKPIGRYIVDFYCAKARLVVELDGGGHYTGGQRVRDEERTRVLEERGMMVVRFANNQVDRMFDAVCARIEQVVRERLAGI
ncbi:endonuclease domain-containing protein [Bifidobacterium amazonense]|uniref:Endonuclease domain-containing protein n=1 Tax=Bifidobacterium amazonense TaxID=2809027 RepID=A0ABS9VVL8_9BIFI|nr:endonuclease domain-containing protein [Bifidobacterium amazonense]MCH9276143.1 endonuclease domain-containing protein [Bifidobacterium amazonense]